MAAEFLHQEYGDKSLWISTADYGMATLVGVSRVYRNRHWVSDVVAGAGVGILSTKIIYWLYPSINPVPANTGGLLLKIKNRMPHYL
jgi:membrane-associated phospholipid phosphatase